MRSPLIILFCLLIFSGCSTGESEAGAATQESEQVVPEHLKDVDNLTVLPADAEPRYDINLVRETNYGDRYSEEVYLGYVNDYAVDDEGRVFLADASNDKIHVYNPDGSFWQSIGRPGRGPGEFLTTRGQLDIGVNDDYLFAFDETNYRISRFSLETFELVDVVNLEGSKWNHLEEVSGFRPFEFYIRDDNRYLVRFRIPNFSDSDGAQRERPTNFRSQYYLFNQQMEPVSENVLEYENTPSGPAFRNQYLTTFSESGDMYHASSEEFFIRVKNPDGTYSRSVYSPIEASPLTNDDLEELGGSGDVSNIPEQWPVLYRINVDDENRLWVSIIRDSHEETKWWVLDENFNLLATFPWPREFDYKPGDLHHHYIIKNGAMYHLDAHEATVVKYRIEMTSVVETSTDTGS